MLGRCCELGGCWVLGGCQVLGGCCELCHLCRCMVCGRILSRSCASLAGRQPLAAFCKAPCLALSPQFCSPAASGRSRAGLPCPGLLTQRGGEQILFYGKCSLGLVGFVLCSARQPLTLVLPAPVESSSHSVFNSFSVFACDGGWQEAKVARLSWGSGRAAAGPVGASRSQSAGVLTAARTRSRGFSYLPSRDWSYSKSLQIAFGFCLVFIIQQIYPFR